MTGVQTCALPILAVHGVQTDGQDLARLRASGTTLVACPRSNAWVGAGAPPVDAFYASRVDVAFGTDSLASVEDLNLFSELATAHTIAPKVPARWLLESATMVGAAALGFARRALAEAREHVRARKLFGQTLAQLQATQMRIADMALEVDTAALLVYRAAWVKDTLRDRVTLEASMAKLHATEAAQRVIDSAVQLFGGLGVTVGSVAERLYREIRPLRIYEGASEIQKLIIAGQVLGK